MRRICADFLLVFIRENPPHRPNPRSIIVALRDKPRQIGREVGDLLAQAQQGQVFRFGFEHDVEGTQPQVARQAQQVDAGERVEEVTVLIGQRRSGMGAVRQLQQAQRGARAAHVNLGPPRRRPGCQRGSQCVCDGAIDRVETCLLYTSPSPRDRTRSRMPSSA